MTTISHRTGRIGAAWTKAAGLVVALGRALLNRRRIAPLLELNDRELRDLGLTRDDLRTALRQPLVRDPSVVLMVKAVDRRSRTRRPDSAPVAPRSVREPAG